MLPVNFTKSLAAASANNIALSQTTSAGVPAVALTGAAVVNGVAILDTQRRVIITSAGNDSGLTFTVTGTNQTGQRIVDTFLGANIGVAVSNLDFLTVTSIVGSGATAASITVGTNSTGSSPWFMPNYHLTPFSLNFAATVVSGAVTYSLETTMDDYWTPPGQVNVPWASTPPGSIRVAATTIAAATTNQTLILTGAVRGWRATITAGTGVLACQAEQAGITNY
jgi:hypothetical protein